MSMENKIFGTLAYIPGDVAFAGGIKDPLSFREKVLLLCVEAARIAYLVPEQGSVWEGEGVLIYKDLYSQYHLYFNTEKYCSNKIACYHNGVGMIGFILVREPEEALRFAAETLTLVQSKIETQQKLLLST